MYQGVWQAYIGKNVEIGENATIGYEVCIADGARIGARAIVGSFSTIRRARIAPDYKCGSNFHEIRDVAVYDRDGEVTQAAR